MRKIPDKLRREMSEDPFYKRCCLTGGAFPKIDWHHNLIFAGRQVNEKFCIMPLLHSVHVIVDRHDIKSMANWVMLSRASEEELDRFSKSRDLRAELKRLNKKYGIWEPTIYILNGKPL